MCPFFLNLTLFGGYHDSKSAGDIAQDCAKCNRLLRVGEGALGRFYGRAGRGAAARRSSRLVRTLRVLTARMLTKGVLAYECVRHLMDAKAKRSEAPMPMSVRLALIAWGNALITPGAYVGA